MKVKLIDKNKKEYEMQYYQVNDFCKLLCYQKDNIDKFKEFEKDYTYFEAYFDFVIFELGYKMKNILFENEIIMANNEEIFTKDRIEKGQIYAYMTKCSDSILRIKKDSDVSMDSLIDPNGYSMMSYMNANAHGNHTVTSRTILNQMFIKNKRICDYFENGMMNISNAINSLGFFRTVVFDNEEIIIGLENILTPAQKEIFKDKKIDYEGETEEIEKEFVKEYLQMVKTGKKLVKIR